jgi:hypothetical protein
MNHLFSRLRILALVKTIACCAFPCLLRGQMEQQTWFNSRSSAGLISHLVLDGNFHAVTVFEGSPERPYCWGRSRLHQLHGGYYQATFANDRSTYQLLIAPRSNGMIEVTVVLMYEDDPMPQEWVYSFWRQPELRPSQVRPASFSLRR